MTDTHAAPCRDARATSASGWGDTIGFGLCVLITLIVIGIHGYFLYDTGRMHGRRQAEAAYQANMPAPVVSPEQE